MKTEIDINALTLAISDEFKRLSESIAQTNGEKFVLEKAMDAMAGVVVNFFMKNGVFHE